LRSKQACQRKKREKEQRQNGICLEGGKSGGIPRLDNVCGKANLFFLTLEKGKKKGEQRTSEPPGKEGTRSVTFTTR